MEFSGEPSEIFRSHQNIGHFHMETKKAEPNVTVMARIKIPSLLKTHSDEIELLFSLNVLVTFSDDGGHILGDVV